MELRIFKTMNNSILQSMLNWFHLMTNVIDGSNDWMETSGSGHLMYRECEGDPLITWKRGYSSLFDILTVISFSLSKQNCSVSLRFLIFLGFQKEFLNSPPQRNLERILEIPRYSVGIF